MEGTASGTPETAHRTGGVVAGFSGAVRLFAGSVGTIGIALYVCGFLISVAQQHLLGLGRLVTYSHDEYVQQGGGFLADISTTLVIAAEPFSLALIFVTLMGTGAAAVWRKFGARHRWWRANARRWHLLVRLAWPPLVYLFLLILLLFKYGDPIEFGLPLRLANILFHDPDATAPPLQNIHTLLIADGKNGLGALFEDRLFTFVAVGLLCLFAHYVTAGQRWRRPAMAPFALLMVLYAFMLPMLYGVLKLRMEFPIVMVWPGVGEKTTDGQRYLLLNMTEQVAVLYLAAEHKVIWRHRDHIERLDVVGMARILSELGAKKAKP